MERMPARDIIKHPIEMSDRRTRCGNAAIRMPIPVMRRNASKRDGFTGYVTDICNE